MKKILNIIFVTLGIIFLLLIILIVCFFVFDLLNLKPFLSNMFTDKEIDFLIPTAPTTTKTGETTKATTTEETNDKHPLLSENQEKILETFGVDVSTLPSELTPEMEECFIEKLGEQTVNEIIGGATPNPIDFFKAKSCLEN